MNSKRPLTPGFLNDIDQELLKNKPVTWSTRIHLALYYVLTFAVALIIISFIVPDDPREHNTISNWIVLLGIVSLLAFIFWVIFLLRFNVFKRFGQWRSTDTVKTFILYFLVIILIVALPFIPPIIQSIRANAAYTSGELAGDINDMNLKLCRLERDSIDTRFARDTFLVRDSVSDAIIGSRLYNIDTAHAGPDGYDLIDTVMLNDKLAVADSVKQLNDSVYVIFHCPEYTFIENFSVSLESTIKVLGSMDIFRQAVQYRQPIDSAAIRKELAGLFAKYSRWHDGIDLTSNYDYSYSDQYDMIYAERLRDKYDLHYINWALNNIADKKYRWDTDTIDVSWRAAYYITLVLALLVLIYRHTTRKTFFLSLLSAVILTIITGLFLAMAYSHEAAFFIWIIVYFIIFLILAATIAGNSRRNIVSGIGLNLLVFITAFMPLVVTAAYYIFLREKYEFSDPKEEYYLRFVNEELHYFIAEIAGFVLLLVLLATIYQKAYRKWYALPEQ